VIQASVGPGQPVASHSQVGVGPEERTEAQILGGSRDAQELVIRGALLRFGEDPQLYAACHGR
jgi:hypothetical protein